MPTILWDSSVLIKRYIAERVTETVNAVFSQRRPMAIATLVYAETCASLRRKFNQAAFNHQTFLTARLLADHEVLDSYMETVPIDDECVFEGIGLTDRHNINSSDATILAAYIRFLPSASSPFFLLATDQRLLRAAAAEGFTSINPELLSSTDITALLSAGWQCA